MDYILSSPWSWSIIIYVERWKDVMEKKIWICHLNIEDIIVHT